MPLRGWEVDDAARAVIETAGYGDRFVHRTGHNIGQEVHGNGAHMDNLETREDAPASCRGPASRSSRGSTAQEFGVRSEVNVFIDGDGQVHVTGGPAQEQVVAILA